MNVPGLWKMRFDGLQEVVPYQLCYLPSHNLQQLASKACLVILGPSSMQICLKRGSTTGLFSIMAHLDQRKMESDLLQGSMEAANRGSLKLHIHVEHIEKVSLCQIWWIVVAGDRKSVV